MTRVNLVEPCELTDQHLFAEFRELKMIPKSLQRSLRAVWQREFDKDDSSAGVVRRVLAAHNAVLSKVPKEFTLNRGHVSFFYNKGAYLHERYALLQQELSKRNINFNVHALLDPDDVFNNLPGSFNQGYKPSAEAMWIIRHRIAEKIQMKVGWYRYYGVPLTTNHFGEWL